jgi:hypothetical protein
MNPDQDTDYVAAELRAWADELCPEWGEELPHVTQIGDLAETHAKLLRQAAKLIEEGRTDG